MQRLGGWSGGGDHADGKDIKGGAQSHPSFHFDDNTCSSQAQRLWVTYSIQSTDVCFQESAPLLKSILMCGMNDILFALKDVNLTQNTTREAKPRNYLISQLLLLQPTPTTWGWRVRVQLLLLLLLLQPTPQLRTTSSSAQRKSEDTKSCFERLFVSS